VPQEKGERGKEFGSLDSKSFEKLLMMDRGTVRNM
jgi:hypothetical protein